MIKLEFKNADVHDSGYGLTVNGNSLENIISTALGTRVGSLSGRDNGFKPFESNCCNITVIIDPQPVTTYIADDDYEYESVEDLEEEKREQFEKKNEKTDPEE